MGSEVTLFPKTVFLEELSDDYILDLAEAGLGVAKDIARIRPDIILVPLTGGYPVFRVSMEALRKNLKIPTLEYDPTVIFVPAGCEPCRNEITNKILQKFLEKRRNLKGRNKFNKLMILDTADRGISLRYILCETGETLRKLAKRIYVSCIVTPEDFRTKDREKKLKRYRKRSFLRSMIKKDEFVKFFFHPSIAVHSYNNKPSIIGHERYEDNNLSVKRDRVSFLPRYNPKHLDREPGISKRFYMRLNDALERLNKVDLDRIEE